MRLLRAMVSLALAATVWSAGAAPRADVTVGSAKDVFEADEAHVVHLRLSREDWRAVQPGGARRLVKAGASREEALAAGARLRPEGKGQHFAYVPVDVDFGGVTVADVGLRLKGNASYSASRTSLRRPMKLDFDRFVEGGRLARKIETLNLSNTTFDPAGAREAVSYWLYRKMNVPAPRTGHALVYLDVAGLHASEHLGLYTVIEEVDGDFLRRHFGNDDGLLLKPGGMRGLAYLGEQWADYERVCHPQGDGPVRPELAAKVVELARLAHRAGDAEFRAKIGGCLNVDAFLRFVAVTSAIVNFDSFLGTGHNYFLYVNPADGLCHFVPWDVNMTFGSYAFVGTDDEIARTRMTRAYPGHNALVERVLAVPEFASAYRRHVRTLVDEYLNPAALGERRRKMAPVFAAADAAARAVGLEESPTTRPAVGMGQDPPEFWAFAERRAAAIRAQLDGRDAGHRPEFDNPGRVPAEWAPVTAAAAAFLRAVDADGDWRVSDGEAGRAIGGFVGGGGGGAGSGGVGGGGGSVASGGDAGGDAGGAVGGVGVWKDRRGGRGWGRAGDGGGDDGGVSASARPARSGSRRADELSGDHRGDVRDAGAAGCKRGAVTM